MTRIRSRIVLACWLLAACPGETAAPGAQGGPCHPNQTCNAGLICVRNVCTPSNLGLDGRILDGAANSDLGPARDGGPLRPDLQPPAPITPWVGRTSLGIESLYAEAIAANADALLLVGRQTTSDQGSDLVVARLRGNASLVWAKTIDPGTNNGHGAAAVAGSTGGWLILGGLEGKIWLIRIDDAGQVLWQRLYIVSGEAISDAQQVLATSDGGFVVVGSSSISGELETERMVVFKIDEHGALQWQKRLDGSGQWNAHGVAILSDGGLAIVGTHWEDRDPAVFLTRLTASGTVAWTTRVNGADSDLGRDVVELPDQQLAVLANTSSSWSAGLNDLWLLRFSSVGAVVSQEAYGGTGGDPATRLFALPDGLLLVGFTSSPGARDFDLYLARVNASGKLVWQTAIGEAGHDRAEGAAYMPGGGVAVLGSSSVGTAPSQWLAALLTVDGELPADCTLGSTINLTGRASTAEVSNPALSAVTIKLDVTEASATVAEVTPTTDLRCR